jgi:hypothetical protein
MNKTTKEPKEPITQGLKKPYARPHLIEYGNVAKLTASGGTSGPIDGTSTMMP